VSGSKGGLEGARRVQFREGGRRGTGIEAQERAGETRDERRHSECRRDLDHGFPPNRQILDFKSLRGGKPDPKSKT